MQTIQIKSYDILQKLMKNLKNLEFLWNNIYRNTLSNLWHWLRITNFYTRVHMYVQRNNSNSVCVRNDINATEL